MSEMNLIIFLCLFAYAMESLIISFKMYALFISSLWRYNRSQLTFPPETSFSEMSTIRTFFGLWITDSSHSHLQQKRNNWYKHYGVSSLLPGESFGAIEKRLGGGNQTEPSDCYTFRKQRWILEAKSDLLFSR